MNTWKMLCNKYITVAFVVCVVANCHGSPTRQKHVDARSDHIITDLSSDPDIELPENPNSTPNRPLSDPGERIWEKIQHRVLHHLNQVESKLIDHVADKTHGLNQTVTINYLYKVYQYLIEEVEIGKRIGEMRAGEIEKVRKVGMEQGKEIVALKSDVTILRALVNNLTETVSEIKSRGTPTESLPMTSSQRPTFPVKPAYPVDCQEVYQSGGMKYEGDYFIKIQPYMSSEPSETCCRMGHKAGWTVIQRRLDGSVNFYRNWAAYKAGFGDPRGEYWLGNDNIHQLTNQDDYTLRIEMTDFDGREHYAEYDHFRILDEAHDYTMHVHGFHGNAGDSLTPSWNNHDGQPFSTRDRDNDDRYYDNCAESFSGAWWFKSCFESHLNGLYYRDGEHDNFFNQNGIQWNTVGHHYSLKSVIMMVKPNKQVHHSKEYLDEMSNDIQ